jgi:membrane-bound serine protease (ClpP class)
MLLLVGSFSFGQTDADAEPAPEAADMSGQDEGATVEETLDEESPVLEPIDIGGAVGVVLPIRREITDVTAGSVERRIEEAKAKGAEVIIFELDTPGGMVQSCIAIADQIKSMTDIKTVAWVNPNAISGGSMISVACDEIVMSRSSRIGDSQVIMITPGGASDVDDGLKAKVNTPVLKEFDASARLNGYSPVLCEAFVLPEREVWWLENVETGERKFVFREEKLKLLGERDESKQAGSTIGKIVDALRDSSATGTEWKLVEMYHDVVLGVDVDASQPVVRDDLLLMMTAAEAHAYGFSKGVVSSDEDLSARYDLSELIRISPTWLEGLTFWMTSMYVRGFLLVIILLGAYVEFHTPGVGVPGLVALICLGIFAGAPYLTGLANIWEILFILLGFILIAVEIFLIPGFGVAGISGILLLLIGLLATFAPDEPGRSFPLYVPSAEETIDGLITGLKTVVASMVISLAGMVALSRYLPKVPAFAKIMPENPTPSEVLVEDQYHGVARVGDVGVAESALRPAGKGRFGSVLVDVVTEGDLLDEGDRIEVIERRGNRVVVRAVR